ncbi:hypothetical protein DEM27_23850 [Metarhizobium album]|uniref:DUF6894 domain-containing protein n=1 Tax=Metarhizobium album TaxID=2182425 RepID=A0A2U2DKW6_9HYPH|nr:hypothetical protein [Rhizobium album]PWE53948.1 hypothetical protein DEM27_23850 [Rhizobium album]
MTLYYFRTLERNEDAFLTGTVLDMPDDEAALKEARAALLDMARERLRDPSFWLLQVELLDANLESVTTMKLTREEDPVRKP